MVAICTTHCDILQVQMFIVHRFAEFADLLFDLVDLFSCELVGH